MTAPAHRQPAVRYGEFTDAITAAHNWGKAKYAGLIELLSAGVMMDGRIAIRLRCWDGAGNAVDRRLELQNTGPGTRWDEDHAFSIVEADTNS